MRNKVFLNRINIDYQTLYVKVKDYFHRHGVEISFDFVNSDYKNLSYRLADFGHGQRVILQPYMANIVPIDPSYDFTSFAFNGMEFPPPNIPNGYCYCPTKQPFMDILLDERTPEANYLLIIHEMMHALTLKANLAGFPTIDQMDTYFENNLPEAPESNFGKQWALLQPYIKSLTSQPMYIYFKPSEVVGLKPELVKKLDLARGEAGIPFPITSGFRTVAQNAAVGGKVNSAHLTGEAVDLACNDSTGRLKIMKALLNQGFTRVEIATAHVHCDISKTLPQNVLIRSDDN